MRDGVFLCWLVQRVTSEVIKGVNKKPITEAHRRANISRAIATLRTQQNMSRRYALLLTDPGPAHTHTHPHTSTHPVAVYKEDVAEAGYTLVDIPRHSMALRYV